MKDTLDINKLRDAAAADIDARVVELKRGLMNARFQKTAGSLKDTSSIAKARKAVARLKTFASKNKKKKDTK